MPTYTGTNGDDSYWGGPDADLIEGLGGQDYLLGNGGDDEILGGDGDDNLHGGDGNDILDGGEGNDLLQGDDGVDTLRGMAGNDRLLVTNLPVAGELFDGGDGLDTLQFDAGGSAPIIFSIFDPAVVQNIYGAAVVNIEQLSFRAGSGNDTVTGGALNDYIDGYDGNDRIDGGLGDDSLDGGLGTDTVYGGGGNDTIRGGGGLNDLLYGDDGDDTFHWNSTDALIDGGAGIDQIRMEYYVAGIDLTVNLSNPNFETMAIGTRVIGVERLWIQGGDGNDRFTGGAWDDVLVGNKGNDILTGGAGNDTLSGGDGNDQLFGGAGDDFLHCYPIFDLNPNDLVDGGDGFDTLEFWAHNATAPITIDILSTTAAIRNVEKISFRGGSGINHVSGGDSTDILFGGVSGDYFDGRGGDDDIRAGDGDNTLIGGSGNDFLEAGAGADVLSGGDGDDILQSGGGNDNLNGGAGNDELSGSDGNDQLWGDFGDDILIGGAGSDSLFGEAGFDIVSYRDASAGVTVNLATGIAQSTAPGDAAGIGIDTIVDVEIAWGSAFADHMIAGTSPSSRLIGWGGDDTLIGGVAFDELIGGDGNDVITGGIGSDRLFGDNGFGNTGNDTFRDTTSGLNTDTIADFGVGDKILFTDATLGAFTFSLTGSTLSYTGGSLTLTGVTGTLVANAAAGGGVQLTLQAIVNDVRNDFNGDGRSDVLWRHDNGSFTTWLANASGGFVSNDANSWNGVPTEWRVVGTGDFNGDGRDDVVWRRTDGAFTEWLAQGNGSFTSNDAHGWTVLPNSWQVDGVGDFNADGKDDLIWRRDDGAFTTWLGQANGGFVSNDANSWTMLPPSWQVAATGDFNGDGRDDIAWQRSDGAFTTWLAGGNGSFASNDANSWTMLPTSWHVEGAGDFNGDGRDDLVWRNDDGSFTTWLAQPNGGFVSNDANSWAVLPTSWQVVEIGDYNGDGRDDILWRNSNGAFTNWLAQGNGSFVSNDANAFTSLTTAWHVQGPDTFFA